MSDVVRIVHATLEDVLAREEIQAALHRYTRGVDRRDAELMASAFHPDATDDHGTINGLATDLIHDVCVVGADRYRISTHFFGPPNIERRGNVADVDTYSLNHGLSHPDKNGVQKNSINGVRYVDRFEKRGEGPWLIAHRTLIHDWTHTIVLDPETTRKFEPGWILGVHDRTDPWYTLTGRLAS